MAYTTRGGCGKAEACEVGLLDQGVVETCAGEVRASKKGALQIAAAEECVVQPGERKVRVLRHHAYGSSLRSVLWCDGDEVWGPCPLAPVSEAKLSVALTKLASLAFTPERSDWERSACAKEACLSEALERPTPRRLAPLSDACSKEVLELALACKEAARLGGAGTAARAERVSLSPH